MFLNSSQESDAHRSQEKIHTIVNRTGNIRTLGSGRVGVEYRCLDVLLSITGALDRLVSVKAMQGC